MTFETLTDVPVRDLRAGDWPIGLCGYRPIQAIRVRPRKRQVVLKVAGALTTYPLAVSVRRVRRPV